MSLPFIVPTRAKPLSPESRPAVDPVKAYIAELGVGSRRRMNTALAKVASFLLGRPAKAEELDWASVRYDQTASVRAWLVTNCSPATTDQVLTAIRGIIAKSWSLGLMSFRDCVRSCELASIRAEFIPRGRALPNDELCRLFETCISDKTIAGIRDTALIATTYGFGLSGPELIALNMADYDLDGCIRIPGKGTDYRVGFVMGQVEAVLNSWTDIRGYRGGPLFCPSISVSSQRMTTGSLARIFRKRATEARIPAFSLKDLRKTYFVDMLAAQADHSIIQQLTGRRQVGSTPLHYLTKKTARAKAPELATISSNKPS